MRDWVQYTWHFHVSWCRFCGTGPRLETWCHPSSLPPHARAAQTAVAAPKKCKRLYRHCLDKQDPRSPGAQKYSLSRILCGLKCDKQLAIIVPGAGVWLGLSSGATCQSPGQVQQCQELPRVIMVNTFLHMEPGIMTTYNPVNSLLYTLLCNSSIIATNPSS